MPSYILKIIFKLFSQKEQLNELDKLALINFQFDANEQELNYYTKLMDALFA